VLTGVDISQRQRSISVNITVDLRADRGYFVPMETTELIANGSEPGIVQLILNRPAQPNAWMPSHQTAVAAELTGQDS
jgi:hypothetical protein